MFHVEHWFYLCSRDENFVPPRRVELLLITDVPRGTSVIIYLTIPNTEYCLFLFM
jgi:hypothetical protein